jgi:hypothetical protein
LASGEEVEPTERKPTVLDRLKDALMRWWAVGGPRKATTRKALPPNAARAVTIWSNALGHVGDEQMPEPSLERCARVLAAWAATMPLRDVYIFDRRPERPALSIAFEYSGNVSDQALLRWQQENASDFTSLRAVLGVPMSLVPDDAHNTWRLIRDAARAPMFTVGKVEGASNARTTLNRPVPVLHSARRKGEELMVAERF